ncbi:stage II sporulation protein D [Crassaminicella thermophila]|uniref:stage II sporulation protein D n=1 Tax=Crassaminicella thermophila TaxID=2599308 RepID=UPI001E5DE21A|nr:stage II sporulation protein D [Crassaminicella thermophila]
MNDRKVVVYVKIYDHIRQKIISEPMTELIKRMVASQIPISFEIEALKAQAIIARTFIIRKMKTFGGDGCSKYKDVDLCTEGHCTKIITIEELKEKWGEDFKKNWEKIEKITADTKEKIITINNKPINPRFHSTCGGATENSENVEGNKTLYLRKVLCDYCRNSPYYNSSLQLSLEEIEKKLNIGTIKASPFKGPSIEGLIEDIKRDEEGRVVSIKIGGKQLKGTEIMKLLGLSSTRFGWKPIVFQIEMQGQGDGLGLCQYGANRMALEGKSAEEILKYYFTGVQIKEFDRPSINKPLTGKIIVLDPGHGGDNTEDVVGPTGLREKDVNLSISLKLAKLLRDAGAEVYETRTEDVYVPLSKRADLANKVRPHFFLSIHQNSFANPNISGSEIYHYRGDREGEILAGFILEELWEELGTIRRGVKTADFYLLREVRCSVLQIETAFITNLEEEKKLRDEKFQYRVAEAIAKGLMKYYRYG